jgi:hypothetical protein
MEDTPRSGSARTRVVAILLALPLACGRTGLDVFPPDSAAEAAVEDASSGEGEVGVAPPDARADGGGVDAADANALCEAARPSGPGGLALWLDNFAPDELSEPVSVALTPEGNTLVVGTFSGSLPLIDESALEYAPDASALTAARSSIFVVAMDPAGTILWGRVFGEQATATGVAVDPAGDIVLTGTFTGPLDFSGPGEVEAGSGSGLSIAGAWAAFVAKLDRSANPLWAVELLNHQESVLFSVPRVAVDSTGTVAVAGGFTGTMGLGTRTLESAGFEDVFVTRLDGDGHFLWSDAFGTPEYDIVADVTVDGAGNTVLAGESTGPISFGAADEPVDAGGRYRVYVAELDGSGSLRFARHFVGGDISGYAGAVATDGEGDVLVTDSTPAVSLRKLDPRGHDVWRRVLSGIAWNLGVRADARGGVFVAGDFRGPGGFAAPGETPPQTFGPDFAEIVAAFDADGGILWGQELVRNDGSSVPVTTASLAVAPCDAALAFALVYGGELVVPVAGGSKTERSWAVYKSVIVGRISP